MSWSSDYENLWRAPNPCDFTGHVLTSWAEYLDGMCVAYCDECKERVTSRRPPGGMPFIRLKALMERLVASPDDPHTLMEISEIEDLLVAEEEALQSAQSLLRTVRMMVCAD